MKYNFLLTGLLFSLMSCTQISDEDLRHAKEIKNPDLFIKYEEKLYSLNDKKEYFFRLVSIQHNSGLAFGYYDPRDIKKDSMFLIYKDNIHYVYQTYFNSLAFKAENIAINSEKFQDWCVFHQRLNEAQKDSIKKIFNLKISIDSLR